MTDTQTVTRPYLKDLTLRAGWGVVALLAITLISAAVATAADARPLQKQPHATRSQPLRAHRPVLRTHRLPPIIVRPSDRSEGWGGSKRPVALVEAARSQIGNGAIYGRARLWCARFVNYVLKATGHPGTGSDQAASFAHYGKRIRGPQVGAIAVMTRRGGGHVGVVSGVDPRGNPIVISGNHNRRVAETVYPASRVYAYVLPN